MLQQRRPFDHRPNLNIARVGSKTRPNMWMIRFLAFANQTIILITGGLGILEGATSPQLLLQISYLSALPNMATWRDRSRQRGSFAGRRRASVYYVLCMLWIFSRRPTLL